MALHKHAVNVYTGTKDWKKLQNTINTKPKRIKVFSPFYLESTLLVSRCLPTLFGCSLTSIQETNTRQIHDCSNSNPQSPHDIIHATHSCASVNPLKFRSVWKLICFIKATYSQQYVMLLFSKCSIFLCFLFQLKKKAKKTKTVNWLPLGKTIKYPADGSNCLVAGWGKTNNNKKGTMSDALMSANVTVINRKKCNSAQFYNRRPFITTGMICAGSNGKNKADTCQVRALCSRR